MKELIRQFIRRAIKRLYPEQSDIVVAVDYAPANIDADFASNVAMVLGKKLGKKPMEVASALAVALNSPPHEEGKGEVAEGIRITAPSSPARNDSRLAMSGGSPPHEVTIASPGFLNFSLKREALIRQLEEILGNPEKFGSSNLGHGKLAIVEYFQLNVAKPPHVGHLRSAAIGDSLKKTLRFVGYKTVSDTHIGDWGTQFGLLLLAYKTLDGKTRVKDNPLQELNELYVEINKKIESQPELRERAKQEFVKLEQGDAENRRFWELFVAESKKEFAQLVGLLKLEPFDYDLGESFYEGRMPKIVKQLEEAKLLVTGETGEKYVDLEKYGLGRLICVKSDGGTTYEMRDLATLAYRYDELAKKEKAELAWNLYVVDVRQSHDFRQVFKTMDMLGYDVGKSKHVEFGFMSLPEGAISTRKGNVISLEKLVEEAKNRALKIIQEKNPELDAKERVAEQVGLAAIKYGDLMHNRKSDIVFRWEEALSFEGNTGPYLQYTYARLKSILRKKVDHPHLASPLKGEEIPLPRWEGLGEGELKVIHKLSYFPDVIEDTAAEFFPSTLASYLYDLAGQVNSFYHSSPVIQEKDERLRELRLAVVMASASVLKTGLDLLGIEAPEEM